MLGVELPPDPCDVLERKKEKESCDWKEKKKIQVLGRSERHKFTR